VSEPRIAVVHDWLETWGGSENVLADLLRLYPQADLYALVDFLPDAFRARLSGRTPRTTFLQRIPAARRHFRQLLPLFPRAIESLELQGYDVVISSSHAVAKGVRTSRSQLHLCYCHTPMRYAWDLRELYLESGGLAGGPLGFAARRMLDRLRDWDRAACTRVDAFVANSAFIRDRIARCYDREATVIHPPVDVGYFTPDDAAPAPAARGYYVAASRLVPYKRMDRVVGAFRELPDRRLIVAGDGPEAARVRAAAGPNVELVGELSPERMRPLLRGARAFVFAAEEDFGILPVEAQACGTPVIAFGRGGALETVRGQHDPHPTGRFFDEQSPAAIAAAVRQFEAQDRAITAADCRANAERFSSARFAAEFDGFMRAQWREFAARGR